MAKRVCQQCNGAGNIVVIIEGKRVVVVCPRCRGSGEEEIR